MKGNTRIQQKYTYTAEIHVYSRNTQFSLVKQYHMLNSLNSTSVVIWSFNYAAAPGPVFGCLLLRGCRLCCWLSSGLFSVQRR